MVELISIEVTVVIGMTDRRDGDLAAFRTVLNTVTRTRLRCRLQSRHDPFLDPIATSLFFRASQQGNVYLLSVTLFDILFDKVASKPTHLVPVDTDAGRYLVAVYSVNQSDNWLSDGLVKRGEKFRIHSAKQYGIIIAIHAV